MSEDIGEIKERRNVMDELAVHPGYEVLMREIGTRKRVALETSLNLTLPHAERDGAAGAVAVLEELERFVPAQSAVYAKRLAEKRAT